MKLWKNVSPFKGWPHDIYVKNFWRGSDSVFLFGWSLSPVEEKVPAPRRIISPSPVLSAKSVSFSLLGVQPRDERWVSGERCLVIYHSLSSKWQVVFQKGFVKASSLPNIQEQTCFQTTKYIQYVFCGEGILVPWNLTMNIPKLPNVKKFYLSNCLNLQCKTNKWTRQLHTPHNIQGTIDASATLAKASISVSLYHPRDPDIHRNNCRGLTNTHLKETQMSKKWKPRDVKHMNRCKRVTRFVRGSQLWLEYQKISQMQLYPNYSHTLSIWVEKKHASTAICY